MIHDPSQETEFILRELVHAFVAAIARRVSKGLPPLPPDPRHWNERRKARRSAA